MVWTADGQTFVYASVGAERQRLVVRGAEAENERPLVSFDELISFVVSPDGERIAFQVIGEQGVLPLSVVVGAGFLVLADVIARTVVSPAEIPIGVVTAIIGAPFFALVLRTTRTWGG